jgi:hypothetical protein
VRPRWCCHEERRTGRPRYVVPGLRLAQRRAPWPAHVQLVATIYRLTANPPEDIAALLPGAHPVQEVAVCPACQMLPHVGTGELTGFIEWFHALARDPQMEADGLLRLAFDGIKRRGDSG